MRRELRTTEEQIRNETLTDAQTIERLWARVETLAHENRRITSDHETIQENLRMEIRRLEPHARFYQVMTTQILENPTLMNEWQSFCLLLKLTDPDEGKY